MRHHKKSSLCLRTTISCIEIELTDRGGGKHCLLVSFVFNLKSKPNTTDSWYNSTSCRCHGQAVVFRFLQRRNFSCREGLHDPRKSQQFFV